jgi:hypothetical protein
MKKDKSVKLEPAEYWEWRTTITEMHLTDSRLREAEVVHKLLVRDAEIASLKSQLYFRVNIEAAKLTARKWQGGIDGSG